MQLFFGLVQILEGALELQQLKLDALAPALGHLFGGGSVVHLLAIDQHRLIDLEVVLGSDPIIDDLLALGKALGEGLGELLNRPAIGVHDQLVKLAGIFVLELLNVALQEVDLARIPRLDQVVERAPAELGIELVMRKMHLQVNAH